MEYYNNGGHNDYSLQDMLDVEMSADMEMYHQQTDTKPQRANGNMQQLSAVPTIKANPMGYSDVNGYMVPIAQPHKVDVDSSVTNWLHGIGNGQQHPENGNPNLIVNPQTGSPINTSNNSVQNSISSRMLSLPNTVQITGGNVQYVNSQSSTQQVYIATTKSNHHCSQSNGTHSYQQSTTNYLVSPSSTPSSTVVDNPFPKPAYSYSCLIAMALKNSKHGSLPVAEIYNFMTRHFPYFKTAPDGWKNSVRHNLSLNKCFEKIENPNADGTNSRKGCLWALNPAKMKKMDEEIIKWNKKDPSAIKRAMAHPEILEMLEQGQEPLYLSGKCSMNRHSIIHPGIHQPHQSAVHQIQPHSPSLRVVGTSQVMNHSATGHQHITILPGSQGMTTHSQLTNQSSEAQKLTQEEDLFNGHADLSLDPSLNEISIQNGIWDDLPTDFLDIPMATSPTAFLMSPRKLSPTPSPGHSANGSTTLQLLNARTNGSQAHDFNSSRVVSAT